MFSLWFIAAATLILHEASALYIPSRYRFPLRMVRPSSFYPRSHFALAGVENTAALLEYFGRDRRTHTVTRKEKRAGENLLRAALSGKIQKESATNSVETNVKDNLVLPALPSSSGDSSSTLTNNDNHHNHHRVAKNTDIVISSLLVRDSNGKEHKKFVVMRNNRRQIVAKPKPKTKVHNWWG